MATEPRVADVSRDAYQALRRVERQQAIIEMLARSTEPRTASSLADQLRVSTRTVERDIERLRDSGVPLRTSRGPGGGAWLPRLGGRRTVLLEVTEIAALLASLTALGPTATESAASAMQALVAALELPDRESVDG